MAESSSKARWLPLESNPDVMNKFVKGMGLKSGASFVDVFGLDPELLAMVPRPVYGVLLLFPIADDYREANKREAEAIAASGGQHISPKAFFMRQTIGNACGTIGLIHCLGNNQHRIQFEEGSYLADFFEKTKGKSPEEIGAILESSQGISTAHEASAQEGQTAAPPLEEQLDLHFICFAEHEGSIYEFDGNKPKPINHGDSSPETLLEDAARVVREKFMSKKPDDLRFTLVAFSKDE